MPSQNDPSIYIRTRYSPSKDPSNRDPDGSIRYYLEEDAGACPRTDCKVGDWKKSGTCTGIPPKQTWTREIITEPLFGGKACPVLTTITDCNAKREAVYPSEPFSLRANARKEPFRFRQKFGIEKEVNYYMGIFGIVLGCIFLLLGHTFLFVSQK